MSDGNFNRALLPQTPYASGVKMGQAMVRAKAERAFEEWLRAEQPQLTDEQIREKLQVFNRLLK